MLDTLHAKTEGVGSWRFDFTEPFEIKEGQVVQVDDVTFQHSWQTIDENSDKVYVVTEHGPIRHAEILSLPHGIWTADEVQSKLQTALNAGDRWNFSNSTFQVSLTDHIMSVSVNEVDTPPDLSGWWHVYSDSTKIREEYLTRTSNMTYTYEQSGTRTWTVNSYNNDTEELELTETRPVGDPQDFSWNNVAKQFDGGGGWNWRRPPGEAQQWDVDEKFFIVDEPSLRNDATHFQFQLLAQAAYDKFNPRSANPLLGNNTRERGRSITQGLQSSQTLGICSPIAFKNSIYLHCPQISGLDVRGPAPHSSSCIAVLHLMNSTYGDIVAQSTYREHRYVSPPHGVISFMVFSLRDAANHELDMKGSRLSLVLSVVDKR